MDYNFNFFFFVQRKNPMVNSSLTILEMPSEKESSKKQTNFFVKLKHRKNSPKHGRTN